MNRITRSIPTSSLLLTAVGCLCLLDSAAADDWPQFLGPNRNQQWNETGIITEFPDDGPKVKWRVPVAGGYSGPAVVGDRVYVTDYVKTGGQSTNSPGTRDQLQGQERILCLDASTGKEVWSHSYDRPYSISYPAGPRCTPTVADGMVYTLGSHGDLLCLNAADGEVIWQKQLADEYKVKTPIWGFAGHPLVDGDNLICLVGGQNSVAVAFDRKTGEEKWSALNAREPGYCPPSIIEAGGTRQLIIWHADAINGLDPKSGKVHWTVPLKPDYGMSIMVPQMEGNTLFASGIGNVGAALTLGTDTPSAEVLWKGTTKTGVYCANSTPVIQDGILYGCDCRKGSLRAVRLSDGERLWEVFEPTTGNRRAGHGTAFLTRHVSGTWFLFSETGDLITANLTPRGYEEISRFHVVDPTQSIFGRMVVWTAPAFANKCVYIRNDKELVCVSLEK